MAVGYLILGLLLLASPAMGALKVEDCLECHEDYKGYAHGSASCTDCHSDITELPHGEKLKRPSCRDCHEQTEEVYGRSVHAEKGLECRECHAVHHITKEKKYCASCHANVAHKSLPGQEKHLAELQCAACHSVVSASTIEIDASIPAGAGATRQNFDRNGDGRIDAREWMSVEAYLEGNFKGRYQVKKRFNVKADVHSVTSKPASCGQCHEARKVFGRARLGRIGSVSYDLPVDVTPFVPEIPSIAQFRNTVHGRRGVACADCHVGKQQVSDAICVKCHQEIFTLYKHTPHGTKDAARCTDCHNPHKIKGYKELSAQERIAVCARCHKDYISKHLWLPNTALHFHYLECTTCHSPESQKSMIFQFGRRGPGGESLLTYEELKGLVPAGTDVRKAIDTNDDNAVSSQELSDFFLGLRQKLGKDLYIDGAILVTKVHHSFTMARHQERECTACHSRDAPFYNLMYIVLPSSEGRVYVPAKDTILSALPISTAIDMTLLGEEKIRHADVLRFFKAGPHGRMAFIRELGLRWIDFVGLTLVLLVVVAVAVHATLRRLMRR